MHPVDVLAPLVPEAVAEGLVFQAGGEGRCNLGGNVATVHYRAPLRESVPGSVEVCQNGFSGGHCFDCYHTVHPDHGLVDHDVCSSDLLEYCVVWLVLEEPEVEPIPAVLDDGDGIGDLLGTFGRSP